MSEFQQEGLITTIHGFYDLFDPGKYLRELEDRLMEFSRHVQIGLLLPSLYGEIHVPKVLDHIIDEINEVNYLSSIVVTLGGADKKGHFEEAREFFYRLRKRGRDVKNHLDRRSQGPRDPN